MTKTQRLADSAGNYRTSYFLFLLFACFFINSLKAQTPGLIVRDGAGNIPKQNISAALDPNSDGYTSATNAGFSGSDLGTNSELVFRAIPVPTVEPGGDLRRGADQRFSELVPDENNYSVYVLATASNLIARFRVGDIMPGSKGYSLMIDADGLFGPADPTYTAANPGFEYELVYETNFRVVIYNVNSGTSATVVQSYDLLTNPQHAQTSVALTTNGSNADYFLDFYAPLSAFTGAGAITNSTPLRFNATTVMSPSGAIFGPSSDIMGDDDQYKSPVDQWYIGIIAQPPCSPAQMAAGTCPTGICTSAPVLNTGILSTATSISGTWTKASYSPQSTATITVYKNGSILGTVTGVSSGTTWTLNGVSGLVNGDIISARAQATAESMCEESNKVVVSSCTPATTSACPVKTSACDGRGFSGTGVAGATLRIYRIYNGVKTTEFTLTIPAGGAWGWNGPGSTGNSTNVCTGTNDVLDGTYIITQQEPGKCESEGCTTVSVNCTVTTATPTITNTSVFPSTTTIAGTATADATVFLYINNIEKTTTVATGGNYSFNLTSYGINVNDVIAVKAIAGTSCLSNAASVTVSCFVAPPAINNTGGQIVAGVAISGTSSETGATITIYNQATNAVIGTTSVQVDGTWTLPSPTAVAGTTYYAVASRGCGASIRSSNVTAANVTNVAQCGTGTISGPVAANAASVSGTLASAATNTTVKLYADGSLIGTTTTSTTSWAGIAVNTTSLNRIYAGAVLQVGIQLPSSVEVLCPNTVTVSCPVVVAPLLSTTNFTIGQGSQISLQISNSTNGTLYTIEDAGTGTDYGASVFGNNSSQTISSYIFNTVGTYNLVVRAVDLNASSCTASSSITVQVLAVTPISGTVRKDANGLTDNTVNGAGTNAGGLHVNLVDGNNLVVASVPVAADGTYSMNITEINSLTGPLRVRLSSGIQTIGNTLSASSLPAGWQSTGEYFGTGTGNDGTTDGTITIASTAVPLSNMNFGVNKIPVTGSAPTFNSTVALRYQRFSLEPASLTPPSSDAMTASDEEDTNGSTVTSFNFRIDGLAGLAGKGKLYYDYGSGPVEITAPVTISNFDQSLLSFEWIINGAGATASFTFAAVDAAGTAGAARIFTINSLVTLPATGLQLQASMTQGKAMLQWETQTEINTSFFTLQWSTDGVQFSNAGNRISAAGNSSSRRAYAGTIASLPSGKLFVRVMLTDKDGKVSYSNVVMIENANATPVVRLYPNPANAQVTISGLGQSKEIKVMNSAGVMITVAKVTGNQQLLNTQSWPAGMYNLQVTHKDGTITNLKLTKQ